VNKKQAKLKVVLENLYGRYNHRDLIEPDPMQFVYRYSKAQDMEIAGFLASALAYGRVEQIQKSVADLLGRMDDKPFEFVVNFDSRKKKKLVSFKHRFTNGQAICDLLAVLKKVLKKYGSIESAFLANYNTGDKSVIPALSGFCNRLLDMHKGKINGLRFLLALPEKGSACKRLNLFLRWMVRKDDVDTGLWKSIDKAKLIVPVDVHMGRLCKIIGLYNHKTINLSATRKITAGFAKICPSDPVKYDFALSRIGIVENCTGRKRAGCENCQLFEFCFKG